MIDVKNAAKIINEKFPDREVKQISDFKGEYLIAAPGKDMGAEDTSDGYFLMNKQTGKFRGFVPTEDVVAFQVSMGNPLKTF